MEPQNFVYILWPARGQDRKQLKQNLIGDCAPALLKAGADRLVLYIADEDAKMRSPAPKLYPGEFISAMACFRTKKPAKTAAIESIFSSAGLRSAGYIVEESIYTEYGGNRHSAARDWPDGVRSPGITAVTLMERPAKIRREEWIRRWHGTMSPVSEAIQPRTRYVRNLVLERLAPDAPPFEGIVAENWPSKKHVSNPFLFYGAGNPVSLVANMVRILRAVTSFLSLRRIQTMMMSEYFIKS